MKGKVIKILAVASVLAFGLWWYVQPSEEAVIRETLDLAAETATLSVRLHPLEAAEKAKKLSEFFTESVSFRMRLADYEEVVIASREEMRKKSLIAFTQSKSLEFKLQDFSIEVDGKNSTVELTANALGSMPGREDQFFDRHRIRLQLSKTSGRWLVSEVKHLKNLRE